MATIDLITGSGSTAITVKRITGNSGDAGKAAGISAWIESVTGQPVTVIDTGGGNAKLILTNSQHAKMRTWLDSLLVPKYPTPSLTVDLAPTFGPWVLSKAVPAIVGSITAGFILAWIIKK